jgi:hypothetical protein
MEETFLLWRKISLKKEFYKNSKEKGRAWPFIQPPTI